MWVSFLKIGTRKAMLFLTPRCLLHIFCPDTPFLNVSIFAVVFYVEEELW